MLPQNFNLAPSSDTNTTAGVSSTIFDGLRKLFGSFGNQNFTLENVIGFHYLLWSNQQAYYEDLEKWYKGAPLNEQVKSVVTKKMVDRFPLKINPIKDTCEKHAASLFGDNLDGIRFAGVPLQFIVEGDNVPVEKKAALENSILEVFQNSGGGSMFVQNGIRSQYLGGSVWSFYFDPEAQGVRVESPSPREFLGIPKDSSFAELREAWIIREISILDAEKYGYPASSPHQGIYYYVEYWSEKEYYIKINDWVIEKVFTDTDGNVILKRYEGPNPYGVVPIVYIPHIRVDSFLGTSIITDTIKGIIKELNLRMADVGDAVNEDSHTYVAIRNVKGSLKPVSLPDGRTIIDLGSSSGLTGSSESQPDMISVQTKSTSVPMLDFVDNLMRLYRREAKHPAVADGEDEGSQRSSLTLITRMFPLVSHINMERIHWTTGMLHAIKIMLKIMAVKGLNDVTEKDVNLSFIIKWSQTLPKDREALLNEISIRAQADLGSPEHLIELLGDVYDVHGEIRRIKAWMEYKSKQEAAAKPTPPGGLPDANPKDPGGPKGPDNIVKKPSGRTNTVG